MEMIIILITNLIFSIALAEIANLIAWKMEPIQIIKKLLHLNWWPFHCPSCISFWLATSIFIFYYHYILIYATIIPFTSLFAALIEKYTKLDD